MNPLQQPTVFVNGILRDGHDSILIVRRSLEDHLLPGYYEFPGGKLQSGESLEVALKRKFLQETGLEVEIKSFLGSRADENKHGAYLRVFFDVTLAKTDATIKPRLNNAHDDFLWYDGTQKHDIRIAPDTSHMINAEEDAIASSEAVIAPKDGNNVYRDIIIYTDGGSRGNPGPSASGFVIMDEKERILEKGGEYLGFTSNDEAEYTAVKLGLEAAKKYHPQAVHVRLDSMLVVNQVNGVYKVKSKELWPIHETVMTLANHFRIADFQHVSREYNRLADAQVNKILDNHEV